MSGFAVGTYYGPAGVRKMNYADAETKLGKRDQKKLENNTYLVRVDADTLGVKLHNTVVVYIRRDGQYQLNSGGWRTSTTKDRINRYGPANVYQANNIWYIGDGLVFEDNVTVSGDGKVLTPLRDAKAVERRKRKLDKLVRGYINGFAEHVIANGLQTQPADKPTEQEPWAVVNLGEKPKPLAPGPGDCWACYFGLNSDHPLKEPLGVDHLLQHMLEEDGPYFVPSLLWKAILTRGYSNPGFIWHMIANEAKRGDSRMLKDVLGAYFRKRKPALLEQME